MSNTNGHRKHLTALVKTGICENVKVRFINMYACVHSIAHSHMHTHTLVSINNYETNLSPYIKIQVCLYVVRPGTSK